MKNAIIYLHGFNSASLSMSGSLLTSKDKLAVLERFCHDENIKFYATNIDYRNFANVVSDYLKLYSKLTGQGYKVIFMGSSLGGFTSEYLAMKTESKAIMINPAIYPSELLIQYIGTTENFETQQPFDWNQSNCDQFKSYEVELKSFPVEKSRRTLLLDMADELIDSGKTYEKYKNIAEVTTYEGGSHSFEHMQKALATIKRSINT